MPRDDVPRSVLPIPDQLYLGVRPLYATDEAAKFPPIKPVRPPKGAPNVLVILIDDVGFGASADIPATLPEWRELARHMPQSHSSATSPASVLQVANVAIGERPWRCLKPNSPPPSARSGMPEGPWVQNAP